MDVLLSKELTLTPENEKTNIILPFTVNRDYEKLIINYSYTPKALEDCQRARELIEECLERDTHGDRELYPPYKEYLPLKNLVTLSLDSPEGYMGAAHRQSNSQHHIISSTLSSPGFFKSKIISGEWKLYLNVHAVVTKECNVKAEILGGDGNE